MEEAEAVGMEVVERSATGFALQVRGSPSLKLNQSISAGDGKLSRKELDPGWRNVAFRGTALPRPMTGQEVSQPGLLKHHPIVSPGLKL